jgi:C-terminal processing protease CtpA/Prc
LAFVCSSAPARGAAPPLAREDALLALCRLWNAVRFTHPAVASESDASWDDALLAAAPLVERDPGALRAAASAMLATLHDPVTTADAGGVRAPETLPSAEERDGVRVVHLNGYPNDTTEEAYLKALSAALALPAPDRGLVVDLRAGTMPAPEQIGGVQYVWSQTTFVAHVASEPVTVPFVAGRYIQGFPPEGAVTSGVYREGRETFGGARVIAPASDARAVPVAFLVDAHAVVPLEAIALQRAGRAAIFSVDGSAGIVPGETTAFAAGSELTATLRTSAPLEAVPVRRGALDAALAWVRDPKPSPAVTVAPTATTTTPEERFAAKTLPDEAHRVLAAFRIWGTIAYVYPYRDLMHDDWDAALRAGLADLRDVTTPADYELALMKMYAHLHDTHGFVTAPALRDAYAAMPPFVARDVEGRPTIVRADPVAARRDGFAVGDVIEAVDGEPVAARTARMRPYIVASTEQSVHELLNDRPRNVSLFGGPAGSSITLRVRGADGRARDVRTARVPFQTTLHARTRPVVDILPGNVGYVDLQRLERADVVPMVDRLAETRAIVFDLRGYPRGTFYVLGPHLTAKAVAASLFRTPVSRRPLAAPDAPNAGLRYHAETRDFEQIVRPAPPYYAKPIVVVIDARAISQSEHTGLFLAASGHARFVGEPTTGANGDVTGFFVPGGVRLNFTGQAVLHPDGSQLQRVGLIPDVRVSQTLRGLRSGDDELLAAGIREALRLGGADATTMQSALAAERASERADARAQGGP